MLRRFVAFGTEGTGLGAEATNDYKHHNGVATNR